jgi:hypothetical protein
MALYGFGALVHQVEELYDILDVMRGELLQHLLIPHPGEMQLQQKHWRYEKWYCEPEKTDE